MKIIESYIKKNDCYKNNQNKIDERYTTFQKRGPVGIMLHSVGCSQSKASVFANTWNKSGYTVAVHAVLQADGTVIQCMPWNYRGWHAGGSANNTHIGIEMTEPDCIKYTSGSKFTCSNKSKAISQVNGTYKTAVELCAKLCTQYNLDPMTSIISHAEGAKKGVASNHGDPQHLWSGLGLNYNMNTFRKAVRDKMKKIESYVVKVTANVLNVRKGPGSKYAIATTVKKDEIYTIVEEQNGWGKLKSGVGWVSLQYVKPFNIKE